MAKDFITYIQPQLNKTEPELVEMLILQLKKKNKTNKNATKQINLKNIRVKREKKKKNFVWPMRASDPDVDQTFTYQVLDSNQKLKCS